MAGFYRYHPCQLIIMALSVLFASQRVSAFLQTRNNRYLHNSNNNSNRNPALRRFMLRRTCTATIAPETKDNELLIPTRKYGYRTKPFSWNELHQIIVQDNNLARLSRSMSQEETYQKYRQELLEEYVSIYDYILHSKFGYPKRRRSVLETTNDDHRWEAYPPPSQPPNSAQVVLVPNDFPYFTESGIVHWVLWKRHGKIDHNDINQAKEKLLKQFHAENGNAFIHWENPPHLKSLPDIDHVHILVNLQQHKASR